jgi:hypothetical protein
MNNFEKILDICIDRLNKGESIDACLASYPESASEIKPYLEAVIYAQKSIDNVPSTESKIKARAKLHDYLYSVERQNQNRPSIFGWFQKRLVPLTAAVAAITVVALGIYFYSPGGITNPVVVDPGEQGNFRLLVSDEENAIEDFSTLIVAFNSIEVHREDNGDVYRFEPTLSQVNLVDLTGLNAVEIWNGNLPDGTYGIVFLYVESAIGTLEADGSQVEVKVPSDKLRINTGFEITLESTIEFVFDISVVSAGNQQSGIKYILKPVISESGPGKKYTEI